MPMEKCVKGFSVICIVCAYKRGILLYYATTIIYISLYFFVVYYAAKFFTDSVYCIPQYS